MLKKIWTVLKNYRDLMALGVFAAAYFGLITAAIHYSSYTHVVALLTIATAGSMFAALIVFFILVERRHKDDEPMNDYDRLIQTFEQALKEGKIDG